MVSSKPVYGAKQLTVTFERREDGGLRVYPDARAVLDDVIPALQVMLSEMYSTSVVVEPLTGRSCGDRSSSLSG
jgi:hypothetical protein